MADITGPACSPGIAIGTRSQALHVLAGDTVKYCRIRSAFASGFKPVAQRLPPPHRIEHAVTGLAGKIGIPVCNYARHPGVFHIGNESQVVKQVGERNIAMEKRPVILKDTGYHLFCATVPVAPDKKAIKKMTDLQVVNLILLLFFQKKSQ
jgi:hypothetical protein